jgi:hypothetical protein
MTSARGAALNATARTGGPSGPSAVESAKVALDNAKAKVAKQQEHLDAAKKAGATAKAKKQKQHLAGAKQAVKDAIAALAAAKKE